MSKLIENNKVKPFTPLTLQNITNFQELRRRHEYFAKFQGIDVKSPKITRKKIGLCLLYHAILYGNSGIGIFFMFYEHKYAPEHTNFFGDIRCSMIVMGALCIASCGLFLFTNQNKLNGLLDYCEKLSKNAEFKEDSMLKIVKFLHALAFIISSSCGLGIVAMLIVFKDRRLPTPIYYPEKFISNTPFYICLCLYQTIWTLALWLYYSFFFATYIVMVEHISTQYKILSNRIKNLNEEHKSQIENTKETTSEQKNMSTVKKIDENSTETDYSFLDTTAELNEIGQLHAELLENIGEANTMFRLPLLFNEGFVILCITMNGILILYELKDVVFVIENFCVMIGSLIYPYLGEKISSTAEDFADAIYECQWLRVSPLLRKKVALLLMMAQMPVGFNSGGFHYSNYLEISQVNNKYFYNKTVNKIHIIFTDIKNCIQFTNIY